MITFHEAYAKQQARLQTLLDRRREQVAAVARLLTRAEQAPAAGVEAMIRVFNEMRECE